MLRKFIIYCTPIVVLAMMAMPVMAGLSVTYPAITHSWPDIPGTQRLITVQTDPNEYGQKVGENFNSKAVSQTFYVPEDSPGFTLTNIIITANGAGADVNTPMSLHIYDVNWTRLTPDIQGGSYTLSTDSVTSLVPAGYNYLTSSPTFIFRRITETTDIPDRFVQFDLTADGSGADSVDLEPNHLYAFEIWPTVRTDAPAWFWLRDITDTYDHGRAYYTDGTADYTDISLIRGSVAGSQRDLATGIYGIPCDGNAYHPMPQDQQQNISLASVTLSWTPGKYAGPGSHTGHMLYLSSNPTNLRYRASSARIGMLTDANFTDPTRSTPYYTPTNLLADTWYYWRVDEYNDLNTPMPPHHFRPTAPADGNYWGRDKDTNGTETEPGTYWSFKTSGPQATSPSPAIGVELQFNIRTAQLSWTKGCFVGSDETGAHQLYFGTSFDAVDTATTGSGTVVNHSYYPLASLYPNFALTSGTTYYWRVDEVNATYGTSKGNIWRFKMPNPAFGVIENWDYDGTASMQRNWKTNYRINVKSPGGGDVNIVAGITARDGSTLRLDYDNSYGSGYGPWSEVMYDYNSPTGIDWTVGGVFTPRAIGIQIDANVHNTLNTADVNCDRLYVGIEDTQGRSGFATYTGDTYAAQREIAIGTGPGVREIKFDLADLTSPNNVDLSDINRVYLGIGKRGSYDSLYSGGTGRLRFGNIKVYVQHCNADVLAQTGDFGGPRASGYANNTNTPRDCVVNYNDIFFFAADWLFNEPNLVFDSNVNPGTSNLMVWYKFDEGPVSPTGPSGPGIPADLPDWGGPKSPYGYSYTITDSSGNFRDGTMYNSSPFCYAYAGHDDTGYCMDFEPGYRTWINVPTSVIDGTAAAQSFSMWIDTNKRFAPVDVYTSVFMMFAVDCNTDVNGTADQQLMENQLPASSGWGPQMRWVDARTPGNREINTNWLGGTTSGGPYNNYQHPFTRWSEFSGRWNHWVLILDGNDTGTDPCGMYAYRDGTLVAWRTDIVNPKLDQPHSIRIGTRSNRITTPTNGFWQGKLDDFRIYNRELSKNEVQWLATDGKGKRNITFIEPENYNTSTVTLPTGQTTQILNFKDFAVIAGHWLDQTMWPQP